MHNCTAKAARLVQVNNCTQQIPCEVEDSVTGKPRLAFADPVNFHLLDYPTVMNLDFWFSSGSIMSTTVMTLNIELALEELPQQSLGQQGDQEQEEF